MGIACGAAQLQSRAHVAQQPFISVWASLRNQAVASVTASPLASTRDGYTIFTGVSGLGASILEPGRVLLDNLRARCSRMPYYQEPEGRHLLERV